MSMHCPCNNRGRKSRTGGEWGEGTLHLTRLSCQVCASELRWHTKELGYVMNDYAISKATSGSIFHTNLTV